MSDITPSASTAILHEGMNRSDSSKYNAGTIAKQLIIEKCNSAENWYPITGAFKAGRARDIADEPRVDKIPAFVFGSGASLDDTLPQMRGWAGGTFCSTSQARTLMYHGIEPSHIVCLDPFSDWSEIEGIDWSKTKTKLILHPGINPATVRNWPNEMLFYIQGNGKIDSWYENEQKKMYTWRDGDERSPVFHFYIRTSMTIFACSPPMQMFVADKLGYGTIFLSGMNWSEYKGKRRSTEYTIEPLADGYICKSCGEIYKKDGERKDYKCPKCGEYPALDEIKWTAIPHPYEDGPNLMISNNGRKSREMHIYYKKNVISAWRLSHQQMYNTDEEGILTEVPFTTIRKVMQKKGLNYPAQSHAMIDRICERYLASVGAYVIVANEGVSFIESERPELDLPAYMSGIHGKYNCAECKLQFVINADTDIVKAWIAKNKDAKEIEPIVLLDHAGEICPNCKKNKMTHENNISIEKNMERINGLIRFNKARENEAAHKEKMV
jgi:hypothetical protein